MIKREITTRIRSIILWAVGFAFMIIGGMTKFDAFSEGGSSGEQLNSFIRSMPRIMRIIYGMEGIDISFFEGYFGLLMLYVLIMAAVHGAFLGANLIHQEFKDRTADFLFVKPMSRDGILLRKLAGGLAVILILEAFIAASVYYVFNQAGKLSLLPRTLAAILLTHLIFFALGFLLTILLPSSKMGQQASLSVILLSYLSISLSQLYEQEWILNLSPIGWYNKHLYTATGSTLTLTAGLLTVLIVSFLGGALLRFRTKDIPN